MTLDVGTPVAADPPLVTVLLPVFNGEAYLAEAIASILRQTYANLELLVLDDGSTDRTPEIIAACDDPRLVAVRSDGNRGLVLTLNAGLARARGELVARMDADDVADPRRIERQVERFRADPDLVALGTAIDRIDDLGRLLPAPRRPARGPAVLRWRLLRGTCLYHPTLMLHRARASADARYSAEFVHAEDYELMLRLSRSHSLDNLPQRLMTLRLHPGSVSHVHREAQRASAARALVEHVRRRYGMDVPQGRAQALLDPAWLMSGEGGAGDCPVPLLLELERRFVAAEPGLLSEDREAVARDAAFFLWKLLAVAVVEWRGGPRLGMRLRVAGAAAFALLRRPGAAFAALDESLRRGDDAPGLETRGRPAHPG